MIVDIPYDPRPQQEELHEKLRQHRFSVLACHRRFGKSVMLINHLLIEAMLNTKKNPRYAYIAPTYRQAKNTDGLGVATDTGDIEVYTILDVVDLHIAHR